MKLRSIKFKSVKSTNDIAHMLIKKKNIGPTIILSEKQTKGRGTMGKKWISKKGNLFLSIYFDMTKKKIDFKKFAVLNAYLLKNILVKKFSNKIKIKWPNDLLIEKKKICGILQETVINEGRKFLIVGIGINTNLDPKNGSFLSTSLKQITNKNIDNKKLFIMIKKKYEKFLFKANQNSFTELKKFTKKI
jgi:BirA family transcriptional regulator, biotin operon repressor / biotin---[acetyl-CoA-carboxylase] ligase